jgi:hypothetical protein
LQHRLLAALLPRHRLLACGTGTCCAAAASLTHLLRCCLTFKTARKTSRTTQNQERARTHRTSIRTSARTGHKRKPNRR